MTGLLSLLRDVRSVPALVTLSSIGLLGGAFAFQYLGGLAPCVLCIWQRWPHGIAIVLGLAAFALAGRRAGGWLLCLAGLVLLTGGGIAAFHVGVEQGWWQGTSECGASLSTAGGLDALRESILAAPVVRCDEVPWSLFGISMAGYNFLISLALGGLAVVAGGRHILGQGR